MFSFCCRVFLLTVAGFMCGSSLAEAQYLSQIGITLLRATTTNLNGSGVVVGQVEAASDYHVSPLAFEVSPSAVGQPPALFTWNLSSSPYLVMNTSRAYPNSLGAESGHANNVGQDFYGILYGVATNVSLVNNYEADGFLNYYIYGNNHTFAERVVNQSFTFGTNDASVNQAYDDFAARRNVLFISGAGFNNSPVWSPATCYNGIGVGVYNNPGSPYGPTADGRSKPDITASGYQDTVTSYSTPLVAGAAALLMQAGMRGVGGSDTNAATNIRTLKALILNGAVKPADWTSSPSAPLHFRYGAGVLNVFNSYKQLTGGKRGYIVSSGVPTNAAHLPTGAAGTVGALSGWDFNTNSSSATLDGVCHYYFNVTNGSGNFTATATLVWNRQRNQSAINNLDLFLYNCANSNLAACSTSLVDNVEHVYITNLVQGRYDLQVWKAGGSGIVSADESYALAWQFVSPMISTAKTGTNVDLTWPLYPAGYILEACTNLLVGPWSANGLPSPAIINDLNYVSLNPTNAAQFFRLRQSP